MLLKFIGKDGSMGLRNGCVYNCYISTRGNYIYVTWNTGLGGVTMDCPYRSIGTLNENWKNYSDADDTREMLINLTPEEIEIIKIGIDVAQFECQLPEVDESEEMKTLMRKLEGNI